MARSKERVRVLINHETLEIDSSRISTRDLLEGAGYEGDEWHLIKLNGQADPTGGVRVESNGALTLKDGDHFRVVPGNATFG